MIFADTSVGGTVEILASKDFTAIPIKVGSPASGNIMKAGTPLKATGAYTTATDAVGILLYDVDVSKNPNGALLVQGVIDATKAQSHCGLEYGSGLMTALNAAGCSIILRTNIGVNS